MRAVLLKCPDRAEALTRTRQLMNDAVPDCLVDGYEAIAQGITLPDPDDVHVLAAAIRCGASAIVTFNLKDFPAKVLAPHGQRVCRLLGRLGQQTLLQRNFIQRTGRYPVDSGRSG